jgi:2',3'-cyclic-nucleotide 2'-phosphodiesterase (5'-nucleotidase family)
LENALLIKPLNFCRFIPGGAARAAALAKAMAADATEAGNEVCMLHGGDATTGTLFYSFFGSLPDAAFMNSVGFDAFVLGNHEFDDGDSAVAEFSRRLDMPVLSYNCKFILLASTCKLYTSPKPEHQMILIDYPIFSLSSQQ